MPENQDFSFKITVGGYTLPEYEQDRICYVESCLATAVSYKHRVHHRVNGENESQLMPVTPYQIEVTAKPETPACYYKIKVDGAKVKSLGIEGGVKRCVKGFKDSDVLREFLFSLPKPKEDGDGQTPEDKNSEVGTIQVECWNAKLQKREFMTRHSHLNFHQASKKDSHKVTGGNYTLATSAVGKVLSPRSLLRYVDVWKRKSLRSKLTVHYRMGHTLQDMGITLLPISPSSCSLHNHTKIAPKRSADDINNTGNTSGSGKSCKVEPEERTENEEGSKVNGVKDSSREDSQEEDDDVIFVKTEMPKTTVCCHCMGSGSSVHAVNSGTPSTEDTNIKQKETSVKLENNQAKTNSEQTASSKEIVHKTEPSISGTTNASKQNEVLNAQSDVVQISDSETGMETIMEREEQQNEDLDKPTENNDGECEIVEGKKKEVVIDITEANDITEAEIPDSGICVDQADD